jgi:maltooligosyltrehalose trehalohydrolase
VSPGAKRRISTTPLGERYLSDEATAPILDRVPRLGAEMVTSAAARFRVWAPTARRVEVELEGRRYGLDDEADGMFATTINAEAGARYRYVLDGEGTFPDPCSRAQPDGVTGASELVDTARFASTIPSWSAPALSDLVIYELHVGAFSTRGTFEAVIPRLEMLRDLGVRAIELMPIGTFPGQRGWGYDGLYTSAPHPVYGGPDKLAELVGAAHRADLGVILDVVYNHLGPGSEAMTAFAPYLGARSTLWGQALDYTKHGVREWAIQNAELWVRDFRVDGLRLDATHAIFDDSAVHVLAELATRVRAINPEVFVISESEPGDLRPIEQWGHDAQWGDELHHAIHALVTGERDGYYAKYGSLEDLKWALVRPQREHLVVCDQNHDQVGNRAFGDRLHGAKLRLAAFCVLLSSGTPLIFMGEEYDEEHPFQFFSDHTDPNIAAATREGRRREFAAFAAFGGEEIPDPGDEATFLRSKLDPADGDPSMREYYRYLLELRGGLRGTPVELRLDEAHRVVRVLRGATELVMNFSDREVEGIPPWTGVVV